MIKVLSEERLPKVLIVGLATLCLLLWTIQQDFSPWRPFAPVSLPAPLADSTNKPRSVRSAVSTPRLPVSVPTPPRYQVPQSDVRSVASAATAQSQQSLGAQEQEMADRMLLMQRYMMESLSGGNSATVLSPRQQLQTQLGNALSRYQAATAESGERSALRIEISELLGKQYDAHVESHEQQVEELESRLADLREQVKRRRDAKSRLVALKLEQLLSQMEGIGWPDDLPVTGQLSRGSGRLRNPGDATGSGAISAGAGGAAGGFSTGTAGLRESVEAAAGLPAPLGGSEVGPAAPSDVPGFDPSKGLKEVLLAVHNYEAVYEELPFYARTDQSERLGWLVRILPYLGESDLAGQFDMRQAWDGPKNRELLDQMPSRFGQGRKTQIRWVESDVRRFSDITDGTSATIACIFGGDAMYWTEQRPVSQLEAIDLFQALPLGGELVVGMYDGSVRAIKPEVGLKAFAAMLTPAGGEMVTIQ